MAGFVAAAMTQPRERALSVPLAVGIGLIASFVQSLGLTIQRRSHLLNERAQPDKRRSEWRRPMWVLGFLVFLTANVAGTIFQIGTLPVVILAPLGAVSLLYNALLARVLLDDLLSRHMVYGTSLIVLGAVLIGYFGTVPEQPRSLPELLSLYQRAPFVAFLFVFLLVFISVLTVSHLTEWQLLWQAEEEPRRRRLRRRARRRRLSAPALATVAEVSENSSGIRTPDTQSDARPLAVEEVLSNTELGKRVHGTLPVEPPPRTAKYGTVQLGGRGAPPRPPQPPPARTALSDAGPLPPFDSPSKRTTVVCLAVAYSAASGTLSGICLLLAKSGVDLLLLTLRGDNQFGMWQAWLLVGIMLTAALLQLWYLNKSLKLADPVLVCPMAFCFYNTSSIALGLVYFAQLDALSWSDVALVTLGTAVLLTGVWVISLHRARPDEDEWEVVEVEDDTTWGPGWHDLPSWEEDPEAPHPAQPSTPEQSRVPSAPLAERAPLAPHLSPQGLRPTRSATMPAHDSQPHGARTRPTISLDHALNEGLDTLDRAHMTPRHRPTLYGILVERGLSIGLSPSSPGFHVLPRRAHGHAHHSPAPSPAPRTS